MEDGFERGVEVTKVGEGDGGTGGAEILGGAVAGGDADGDGAGCEGGADVACGVAENDEAVAGPEVALAGSGADEVGAVGVLVAEAAAEGGEVRGEFGVFEFEDGVASGVAGGDPEDGGVLGGEAMEEGGATRERGGGEPGKVLAEDAGVGIGEALVERVDGEVGDAGGLGGEPAVSGALPVDLVEQVGGAGGGIECAGDGLSVHGVVDQGVIDVEEDDELGGGGHLGS